MNLAEINAFLDETLKVLISNPKNLPFRASVSFKTSASGEHMVVLSVELDPIGNPVGKVDHAAYGRSDTRTIRGAISQIRQRLSYLDTAPGYGAATQASAATLEANMIESFFKDVEKNRFN